MVAACGHGRSVAVEGGRLVRMIIIDVLVPIYVDNNII